MESLVLNKDNVKLKVKASDWEEAVRIGAGMLVEQGCAKQSYVDGIIASVKELGPYIVIADGIAMPHTRPEQGAIGIGCSLITLDQPVKFDGDDSEVKVMICFSAVDSESHMDILKMIVEFVERGLIDDIAKEKGDKTMLQILTVCGAGLGSSFACQMSVDAVLKELGVEAKLDHTDISSVGGAKADIILSGKNFEKQFERYTLDCPTIFLDRLVDKNEIKEKLTPVLKDLGVL